MDAQRGEYVGWVDKDGSKIIVRAQIVLCIIKRKDNTFMISCDSGIRDDGVKELLAFNCLQDAHAWLDLA